MSEQANEIPSIKNASGTKTAKRAGKYVVIGIILTIFNFLIYTLFARIIFNNNELLWLDTIISYTLATFLAYLLHSKITWKERKITKTAKYKFFIWNLTFAFAVGPWITQLFSLITPLYDLAFNICQAINISFSYDFVQSTGAFALTSLVIMILNYLFYDKFVFGKTKKEEQK